MLKIKNIYPDSLGEELELLCGDVIIQLNGHIIRDPLDFQFWFAEEEVIMIVREASSGKHIEYEIEKDYDENLGVDFVDTEYEQCKNKCLFCFVHQQPPGMRQEL